MLEVDGCMDEYVGKVGKDIYIVGILICKAMCKMLKMCKSTSY
jgi:hypothetical protein